VVKSLRPLNVIAYSFKRCVDVVWQARIRGWAGLNEAPLGYSQIVEIVKQAGSQVGLVELLLIVLIIAAIAGGIGLSPFLWLLLLVAVVILLTSGGFGYRRGGRL
jgi:hypothetical protein